jgi:hypothetical protein
MAYRINHPKIGMNVYQPFAPAKAGILTAIVGKVSNFGDRYMVNVLWLNGEKTTQPSDNLNDLDALIEDHKKKLATHLKTLDLLKGLIY